MRLSLIPTTCIIGVVGFVLNLICLYACHKMPRNAMNGYLKIIISTQNVRLVGYLGLSIAYFVLPFKKYIRHGNYFSIQFYVTFTLLQIAFMTSLMEMCMSLERAVVLVLGYKNKNEKSKVLTRPLRALIVCACLCALNAGFGIARKNNPVIPFLVTTILNLILRFGPYLITFLSNICIVIFTALHKRRMANYEMHTSVMRRHLKMVNNARIVLTFTVVSLVFFIPFIYLSIVIAPKLGKVIEIPEEGMESSYEGVMHVFQVFECLSCFHNFFVLYYSSSGFREALKRN